MMYNLNLLNTSKTTNMSMMFWNLGVNNMYLENSFPRTKISNPKKVVLDVSSFDTSKVVDMSNMFDSSAIESIDITKFDNYSLTNTWGMFGECALLKSIDLRGFGTATISTAQAMFTSCESLENITFDKTNFENATNLNYLFHLK